MARGRRDRHHGDARLEPERRARDAAHRALQPSLPHLAYQGLDRGLKEDAAGLRLLDARAKALLLAYDCDKNFGLHRGLAVAHFRSAAVAERTGMSVLLPLSPAAVMRLSAEQGIYLADDGRADLAGVDTRSPPRLIEAVVPFLEASWGAILPARVRQAPFAVGVARQVAAAPARL